MKHKIPKQISIGLFMLVLCLTIIIWDFNYKNLSKQTDNVESNISFIINDNVNFIKCTKYNTVPIQIEKSQKLSLEIKTKMDLYLVKGRLQ
jgi:hypothetical protein